MLYFCMPLFAAEILSIEKRFMAQGKIYTAALIGCGRIGYSLGLDKKREQPASHTMALNENPRVQLIAACDKDAVVLNQWHEANKKCQVYRNSANLYARNKPDIITIAVNENSHVSEALDAIMARPGLIILEKPVALSVDQALRIYNSCERNNVAILVNHERRFAEDYNLAKSFLSEIGDMQSIRASLHSGMVVYSRERDFQGQGAFSLLHDGTHLVDSVLFFLEQNMPSTTVNVPVYKSISEKGLGLLGMAEKNYGSTRVVNSLLNNPLVTGILRDENGDVRQFSAHYQTKICPDVEISIYGRSRFFAFDIEITGTEGRISIGNGYLKLYKSEPSELYTGFNSLKSQKNIKVPKKTLYFTNMVANAVNFLDGKEALKSTLQNGINALAVLEEIKEFLK